MCETSTICVSHTLTLSYTEETPRIVALSLLFSMEAHHILLENGFSNIYSYGAGSRVKMPGEAENRPNIYDFGTSYTQIYNDLRKKNQSRSESDGLSTLSLIAHAYVLRSHTWSL